MYVAMNSILIHETQIMQIKFYLRSNINSSDKKAPFLSLLNIALQFALIKIIHVYTVPLKRSDKVYFPCYEYILSNIAFVLFQKVTRKGKIIDEKTYRLNMAKKEHRKHVRDLLATAIVHKTLDVEVLIQHSCRLKSDCLSVNSGRRNPKYTCFWQKPKMRISFEMIQQCIRLWI